MLNEGRAPRRCCSRPNIAVTYDIGESSGADFIVMEYVEGELLSSRVAKDRWRSRVVDIGLQVTDALDEAHARGIVHRDVKSANLMLAERGLVKVLDFGLAKFLKPPTPKAHARLGRRSRCRAWCSAPCHIWRPSRRWAARSISRTDLFSLGVVLYELAAGRSRLQADRPPRSSITFSTKIRRAVAINAVRSAVLDTIVKGGPWKVAGLPLSIGAGHAAGSADVAEAARRAPRGSTGRRRSRTPRASAAIEAVGRGDDVFEHHARGGGRLDRHRHRGDGDGRSQNIQGLSVIGRARCSSALKNLSTATSHPRRVGWRSTSADGSARPGSSRAATSGSATWCRITAKFMDVGGAVRRTVKVDGRIGEIFELQDKIVFELSQGLNLSLRGPEIGHRHRDETESVEAYEARSRGMMNLRLARRDSLDRAISFFERALTSRSELFRLGRARLRVFVSRARFLAPATGAKGRRMARRRRDLNPNLATLTVGSDQRWLTLGQVDEPIAAFRSAPPRAGR